MLCAVVSAVAFAGPARASPVEVPPVYLEGEVTVIQWADPDPHLELAHRPAASLPRELNREPLPPQAELDAARQLLARARPAIADDRLWRVELPTLARLTIRDLPRPKIGSVVGVVGHLTRPVAGSPTIAAEILFIGGRGYPLGRHR